MAAAFAASSDERGGLVLTPSEAISCDETLTLTGPTIAAKRFSVPCVTLKHVQGVKRYVVLPRSADHRPVTWTLQNLQRRDSKDQGSDDTVKYEVVGDPWQAVLTRSPKPIAATHIVQADVRYAWQADGRCLGAAFFDVETAGAVDCPLELPAGFQLLQLSVDGLPVDAVRGGGGEHGPCRWLPSLPPRTWNCSSSRSRQFPKPRPVGPGSACSAPEAGRSAA